MTAEEALAESRRLRLASADPQEPVPVFFTETQWVADVPLALVDDEAS